MAWQRGRNDAQLPRFIGLTVHDTFHSRPFLLEKLADRHLEGIGQFDQRRQAEVLLPTFDCTRKRARKSALVCQIFLGPLFLEPKRPHATAQVLPDADRILHPLTIKVRRYIRPRPLVGRSVVG